jgi:hypothetical protein
MQLEITETTLMEDRERSQEVLARLKQIGVAVFIDDFGTGYSSLSYITTMPVHALKIDRSFVMNMMRSEQDRTVVAASISLAHLLGLRVVSEAGGDDGTGPRARPPWMRRAAGLSVLSAAAGGGVRALGRKVLARTLWAGAQSMNNRIGSRLVINSISAHGLRLTLP